MTARIRLRKFAILGEGVASVSLGDDLTVVSGPSDTGKSFVVDVIDFMFGAKSLRGIPESDPYSYASMQIEIRDEGSETFEELTLYRPLDGGKFRVYEGMVDGIPDDETGLTLSAEHNSKNELNLSNYLLAKLGIAGAEVRRNARNITRTLSFRDLAHFTIIDETRMQSKETPVWPSGNFVSRTSDESVFKFLLQGEDDSGLTELAPSANEKKITEGKNSMLDRVIVTLEQDLQEMNAHSVEEARDQLLRLSGSLREGYRSISSVAADRNQLLRQCNDIDDSISGNRKKVAEMQEIFSRLSLLQRQYQSDIERLEMIGETGQLLGMAARGDCLLCGASVHDQHWEAHHDIDSYSGAVSAEIAKTTTLSNELKSTLNEIRREARLISTSINDESREKARILNLISTFDDLTLPMRDELNELISTKTRLERIINIYEQVSKIEVLRRENESSQRNPSGPAQGLAAVAVDEFCEVIKETLHEWGVAGVSSVRYDFTSRDIVVGGKARATSGKGMRALLHAAFSVSLARYCVERDLPHTGFVVVDSPLVTYREPDGDSPFGDEYDPNFISERFYSSLSRWDNIQFIVMENIDPIDDSKLEWIRLTKNEKLGRYGFFPG
ncbi:hypothetical protein [Rhodococcus erythropolis]|uniref:hypothetical protein n=1 Tax=Rhodococcus erythropolis TaxID=1833 RepID=UPI001F3E294A|nr:hypothetical protein [Rhodococcus erythropolis]